MNNIRGFSNSLPAATQLPASDLSKQQDSAAPNKQSNAFGEVLTGLSQQGGQQAASSGNSNNNGWKALASERFSAGNLGLNQGASISSDTNLGEVAADKTPTPEPVRLKNPLQLPPPSVETNSPSHDVQTKAGASRAAAAPSATDAANVILGRVPSARANASVTASLVSPQADVEDGVDLPAATSGSSKPTNKAPEIAPSKSVARSATNPQQTAKTPVQPPTLPSARQQQMTAIASANTGSSAQSVAPAIVATIGQHATQTSASASPSTADRRRRTESDSVQASSPPNADAQQLANAAMAIPVVPVAPSSSGASPDSQKPTDATHGLPGANVDPAKAVLSALHAEPEQETDEQLGAPIKLDSVSQTTHFAPVEWLSPTQQIVNTVSGALTPQSTSDAASGASASAPVTSLPSASALSTTSRSSPLSLKTLDLKLDPQDLGSVSIKLNLSATGLTVEVQASQASTADLIEKDKHALTDGLTGAGYTVSGVDISFAPSSAASGFTDQGLTQNSFGQSSGDSQANGGSQTQGGADDSFSRQNPNQDRHGNPEATRSAAQRSAGSDLYI